jgi:hypothetical protein
MVSVVVLASRIGRIKDSAACHKFRNLAIELARHYPFSEQFETSHFGAISRVKCNTGFRNFLLHLNLIKGTSKNLG